MTTRRRFVAGAVATAVASVSRRGSAQSPIQIRISTAAPPSDFLTKALNALATEVNAAGAGLAAAEAIMAGPAEIAIIGPADDPRTAELHRTALRAAPSGAVLALGNGRGAGDEHGGEASAPLLAGRGLVGGAPAAYVCRQFTCQAPVTTPEQLEQVLARPY